MFVTEELELEFCTPARGVTPADGDGALVCAQAVKENDTARQIAASHELIRRLLKDWSFRVIVIVNKI